VPQLLAARVVQGLAAGLAIGAVGAGMLDLNRTRGTIANAVAPMTGTALGAAVAGVLVSYLPAPERLVYLVLLVAYVLQAVGVALMAETSTRQPGALASLRPTFSVPGHVRRQVLTAVPALVAAWSLAGFYGSLGPALTRALLGSSSPVLGGLAFATLAGSAALSVLLLRATAPDRLMTLGTAGLALGVGITLLGVVTTSVPLFFVGSAVAGAGFGGAFQGAIRRVLPRTEPHERAGVLSVLYVVSYLAFGLPAVGAGVLVDHVGVLTSTRAYAAVVMVLAGLALLGLLRRPASDAGGARLAAEHRQRQEAVTTCT
jgi:MFS family permease